MTKAEIISLVKNTLMKVDEQGRYREPLLERHIGIVYEQMFNELYAKDRKNIQKYAVVSGEGAISAGLITGHTLLKQPISLPRKGGGLFRVYSSGASAIDFVVTDLMGYENMRMSRFDTVNLVGRRFCYLQGGKLWGNTNIGSDSLVTHVIPQFTEFASTDEVLIPGGASEMLVDRVIDTIRHMPPSDLINDNTIQ